MSEQSAPEVIEESSSVSEQSTPEVIDESSADSEQVMIEDANLSKFYGHFTDTRDVKFAINRGEVVA